jgi:hypothetical protein
MMAHAADNFVPNGKTNWIATNLGDLKTALAVLVDGIKPLHVIRGITQTGQVVGDATEMIEKIRRILVDSHRVFRQEDSLLFLVDDGSGTGGRTPRVIVEAGTATNVAPSIIGNVVVCEEIKANSPGKSGNADQPETYRIQFMIPEKALQLAISSDHFMRNVPEARFTFSHGCFDEHYKWLDSGYNEVSKVLVFGDVLPPTTLPRLDGPLADPQTIKDVISRLPPLLANWVTGFHWQTPVDVVNYVGAALMIPLMPALVDAGHPGVMIWANKQGVGKTLLAQALATLKEGATAGATTIDAGSREVENQIASELNDGRTTLLIDNLRGTINSTVLEANMTMSRISIRGFFTQRKISRPNTILWLLTSNDAVPTDDLLQRCIHVHLYFEGDVGGRQFSRTEDQLKAFLRSNRSALIAELAGMVERWKDLGYPHTKSPCRFEKCGDLIGSILHANGLPGFLSNARVEMQERSERLQQLIAVAERIIADRKPGMFLEFTGDWLDAEKRFAKSKECRMKQADWIPYLATAGAFPQAGMTLQKQKTLATQFINAVVNVSVEISVDGMALECRMLSASTGGREKRHVLAFRKNVPSKGASKPPAKKISASGDVGKESSTQQVSKNPMEGGLWGLRHPEAL